MTEDQQETLRLDPTMYVAEDQPGRFAVGCGWMGSVLSYQHSEAAAWHRARQIATARCVQYAQRPLTDRIEQLLQETPARDG